MNTITKYMLCINESWAVPAVFVIVGIAQVFLYGL